MAFYKTMSWRVPPKSKQGRLYGDTEKIEKAKPFNDPAVPRDLHMERKERFAKVRPFAELIRSRFKECRRNRNYSGPGDEEYIPVRRYADWWAYQIRNSKDKVGGDALRTLIDEIETGNVLERLCDMHKLPGKNSSLLEDYEWKFAHLAAIHGGKGKAYRSLMHGVKNIQPRFNFKKSNLNPFKEE